MKPFKRSVDGRMRTFTTLHIAYNLCQSAEHEWAGVPCGIMDQLAVNAGVAGHALKIDCSTLEIASAPLPANLSAVVVDSKVKHALADGEYAKRRADCEDATAFFDVEFLRDVTIGELDSAQFQLGERVYRRARHVITEMARVRDFAAALFMERVATSRRVVTREDALAGRLST